MLVLSRKQSQRIRLGDSIVITVVRVAGDKVRLGIEAPRDMLVLRDELEPHDAGAAGGEGRAPLAGNTIGTDRMFLAKYMPRVDRWLHYRNIDVSSIKELSRRWYPRAYFQAPAKNGGHRALADIRESIRELAYYRSAVFVPEPGPTSDDAKQVAAAVVSSFAPEL